MRTRRVRLSSSRPAAAAVAPPPCTLDMERVVDVEMRQLVSEVFEALGRERHVTPVAVLPLARMFIGSVFLVGGWPIVGWFMGATKGTLRVKSSLGGVSGS